MGCHKIKKLYTTKELIFKLKRPPTHRMGENIFQLYIRQRTDNQNIQGAQKTKLSQNHCVLFLLFYCYSI
jgi:hypothetical protein